MMFKNHKLMVTCVRNGCLCVGESKGCRVRACNLWLAGFLGMQHIWLLSGFGEVDGNVNLSVIFRRI